MSKTSSYLLNQKTVINAGFKISSDDVLKAVEITNIALASYPVNLYRSVDYKATSGIVGAAFCHSIAEITDSIVNPIEKGHPDVVPPEATNATEAQLRNYPAGLEVKTTIGNVRQGSDLKKGQARINFLTGLTWQAHHQEVEKLLGIIWDFQEDPDNPHAITPFITAVFYADNLDVADWGAISGTTGRNTKVSGMRSGGKNKMGNGWIALYDEDKYLNTYARFLGVDFGNQTPVKSRI